MRKATALSPILVLALVACGSGQADDPGAAAPGHEVPDLPSPAGDPAGSITGMPAPGSGSRDLPPAAAAEVQAAEDTDADGGLVDGGFADGSAELSGAPPDTVAGFVLPEGPDAAAVPPPPAPGPEAVPAQGASADEAMATIRRYYSAISSADYAGAHRLWSGDGSASGQSLEQFASGFADTADVRVHMMEPGRPEGAAGSRYIRVPVTLDATRRDGSTVQYTGSYTLRQPNDGSGSWRIDSADLREVQR
ncbi:hypothetical protein LY625_04215 [Lysobacter sp. GX 14042]|uniref:hypothetical protein n=1 Tax=Lysobacter sp. GX 14042 TaxID=2907155 RepID=UPI001F4787ED|nr:hypothetical protein [Lysobacter sp. GX 14042]MCE7031827.1 hypothetical protein [Lysobacter sp. GX 14042]